MNNSLFISPTDFDSKKTQQCTGLKDKNGKLIYEGDILKGLFADNLLIIENLGWEFSATSLNKKYGNYFLACELKGFEIIGNIYENKDLLNA